MDAAPDARGVDEYPRLPVKLDRLVDRALEALEGAVAYSGNPVTSDPVILGRIDANT